MEGENYWGTKGYRKKRVGVWTLDQGEKGRPEKSKKRKEKDGTKNRERIHIRNKLAFTEGGESRKSLIKK